MPKTPINPESVFRSLEYGFSQAVLASGRQTLYLSGQTAWDAEKQIVGGRDLGAQARQAFMNIRRLVEAAGGTLDASCPYASTPSTTDRSTQPSWDPRCASAFRGQR